MILNKEKKKVPIDCKMAFVNYVEANGFIWFWDMFYDTLFFCELGSTKVQKADIEIDVNIHCSIFPQYSKIFLFHNKIICTPRMADKILIYDIEKKESRYVKIGIDYWSEEALKFGKFFEGIARDKYAYFIGGWSSYLIKFNMEKECVETIIDLYENMPNMKRKDEFCFGNGVFKEDILLIPSSEFNLIFKVHVDEMIVFTKEIPRLDKDSSDEGFSSIYADGNHIWLAPRKKGPIICWDYGKDDIIYFNNYPKEFNFSLGPGIGFIAKAKNSILFFPLLANKILAINVDTGKMKCEKILNEYYDVWTSEIPCNGQKYYFVEEKDEQLHVFARVGRELLLYDPCRGIIRKGSFILPNEYYKMRVAYTLQKHIDEYDIIAENKYMLNDILKMIIRNMECRPIKIREKKSVGYHIYKVLKHNE